VSWAGKWLCGGGQAAGRGPTGMPQALGLMPPCSHFSFSTTVGLVFLVEREGGKLNVAKAVLIFFICSRAQMKNQARGHFVSSLVTILRCLGFFSGFHG